MLNSVAKVAQKVCIQVKSVCTVCLYNNFAIAKVTVFKFLK